MKCRFLHVTKKHVLLHKINQQNYHLPWKDMVLQTVPQIFFQQNFISSLTAMQQRINYRSKSISIHLLVGFRN